MYILNADYRKYFYRKPFTVAFRGMYFGRVVKDQNNDLMYPIFLGNEYFIRGYNYNSMTRTINNQQNNNDNITVDNLLGNRSEEHTYELQSLMRITYAVICFKNKNRI